MEPKKPRTNPKPLHIGVIGIPISDPTLIRFQEKGHIVEDVSRGAIDQPFYDVIIGPLCWRIDPRLKLGDDSTQEESLERQLEMMEKGVRAIKFPKEKPDAK
jgi:hypothetical protein